MAGATSLVVRRLQVLIEVWDLKALKNRKRYCGRCRLISAPLEGKDETGRIHTPVCSCSLPAEMEALMHSHSYADAATG